MSHAWKFFRAGGFNQVVLGTGADLLHLDELDQKLWVALACPVGLVEFDPATLAFIDTDKDGRVRAPELIAAVKWACGLLADPGGLLAESATLRPAAINETSLEGRAMANFARQVLQKPANGEITIDDAAAAAAAFAAKPLNGDGIVPADSAQDDATKTLIADIIACMGTETDASGKPGVSQAKVDEFFAAAAAYSAWWAGGDAAAQPLGPQTQAAAKAVQAVKSKVEDYFTRCRLAVFDPRSAGALNPDAAKYAALGAGVLSRSDAGIAGLPLAFAGPDTPLPLGEGINPAWAEAMADLQTLAITPLLGPKTVLTEADWNTLTAKLAAYNAWAASKAGASVEKIGLERAREILAGNGRQTLTALIASDKAEEANSKAVSGLHRLLLYHRDIVRLCRNFVNFRDFYERKDKAIFQAGALFLDQRSCELCLIVTDPASHATMAGLAGIYLAYCDCSRKGTGEKLSIVAAFTGGDSDNLMVGRNGIFYDRKGRDWDATITKIVENPISVREAFWLPYKKLVRMLEERAAKQAATADAGVSAHLLAAANTPLATGAAPPAAAPAKPAFDPSVIALISLALGSLAAAFAGIMGFLKGFEQWQIPLVIGGILLVISAPSIAIAWLKLRKRNLGPILDASGWAVNARARMNVPFGAALTRVAALPAGASFGATDPYADKRRLWPKLLLAAFIVWFVFAFLNDTQGRLWRWTDGKYGRVPLSVQEALDKAAAPPAHAPAGATGAAVVPVASVASVASVTSVVPATNTPSTSAAPSAPAAPTSAAGK